MIKYSDGTAYSYSDSNQNAMEKSPYTLDSTSSGAVANTLNPLFSQSFALYNDEPPSGAPSRRTIS